MKNKIITVSVFLLLCLSLHARNLREELNFDADWRFARYGLQPDGSRLPEPPAMESPATDDSHWKLLNLPHDWAIEGPFRTDLEGYTGKLPWRGIGWYRKHFDVSEEDRNKCFYLDFDGAMAHAEVWLNGKKIGYQPYGYISFRVDLTPYIHWGGKNTIAVRLNTEKWGSRWYPGAGIYRHVRLVKTSRLHVGQWGVFVTTPQVSRQQATAKVQVSIRNRHQAAQPCHYTIDIYEVTSANRRGKRVAHTSSSTLNIKAGDSITSLSEVRISQPKLWELDAPCRYLARVTVYQGKKATDSYDALFGIRTIEFSHDKGFLLNGKHVPIQGTCNHHDLGALGAAINRTALRRQLLILKSFGCNAIRTSHNPPAPELLELADELGLLVMDEIFDCWTVGKKENDYASLFKEWHQHDISNWVRRDRNHPSIILWSTGNEVDEQYHPETGIARHLTELVHQYDTTRPVTFGASYPSLSAMNGTELQVDVHGMNYAAGCYGGPHFYGDFLNKKGHEHLAGFSSESSSTISSRGEYFPRKFQMSAYDLNEPGWGGLPDQEFAALDRYPSICGEFVWTGFDYLGEPTPFNSDNSVLLNRAAAMTREELEEQREKLEQIEKERPTSRSSFFGIVDLAGFPKDRYYLYQSRWMPEKPMVHILPHWNFTNRTGQTIPVFIYTSGNEAELFLNNRSLGRKKKGEYEYRLRWDSVTYEPGELKAVAYRNGKVWAETSVCTTGKASRLKLTAEKTTALSDGEDLIFVRVSITDEQGREVPDAENVISCTLQGSGKVIATDNGDPNCLIPFGTTTRPAFNGLLLAIVKPDRNSKGTLTLQASADGLQSATLQLNIKKAKRKSHIIRASN